MRRQILGWLLAGLFTISLCGCDGTASSSNTDIDKIIRAKQIVRTRLNYPDTADFHELKTSVNGNTVHLVVTAKNAFGVPSTHTFDINVSD